MKRAALYLRVSTDKQELENQALQLREFCKRQDYKILYEYSDIMSGAENKRPAYNQMFLDAHKFLFDVVVFWDLSRFSRSGLSFTVQKLQELNNLKIDWESYQEQYFRSAGSFKDVLIAMMATLAKIEREKICERTKAGLERVKAAGKVLGRPKGSKDKKKRRVTNYYDNRNGVKKGGSEYAPSFYAVNYDDKNEQINAPLSENKEDSP